MITGRALQCGIARESGVRASYAEISRFVQRTRCHGITSRSIGLTRCLSTTRTCRQPEVNEATQKALNNFKATIRDDFGTISSQLGPRIEEERGEVSFAGYLGTRRVVSKKLAFGLLREPMQRYCIQVVSYLGKEQAQDPKRVEAHDTLCSLKDWTPVIVKGRLKERAEPSKEDTAMGMSLLNTVEMELDSIEVLNEVPRDLLLKEDTVFSPEQRHLQLRTGAELRHNLLFRYKVTTQARKFLGSKMQFREIETPILFKSTPEGAREFLVPTRTKGLAYALPQSPQQYKQILMASGFTRYYQFARCFRDEDLRADRQPEFTQLDIEMAFAAEEDIMGHIESLLRVLWGLMPEPLVTPFQRMTYADAMASYGSDKPDLRLGMEIHNITERLPQDLISKISDLESPAVDAFRMKVSDDPKVTRKFITDFLDSPEGQPFLANPAGQPGVFVVDASQPMQGLFALGHDFVMDTPEALAVDHGDLLILQARKNEPFSGGSTPLGNLRLALHKAAVAQDLISKPTGFHFVWITDFPLFTPNNDTDPGQGGSAGFSSTHHPFTAPKTAEDVDLLLTAPEKVTAAHYDIVVNGVELGGGSRRIHNAEVQEFILRDVLKMSPERLEDFRHLLDVLRSGCPPHAGIALGWDRLVAVMLGKESVRDVIAFPKSGKGEDMLVKSPNRVTKEQWDTYHLQLKE